MTVREIIDYVDEIKPNAFSDTVKLRWLNLLEGRVTAEVLLWAPEETAAHVLALTDTPIVERPYDEIYTTWLAARIDEAHGEYDRYAKSAPVFNAAWSGFVTWFAQLYDPVQGYGLAGRGPGEQPPYYLTAYGLAVKEGFEGTLGEWLDSLKGEKGDDGADGTVSFDELTPEQIAMLKGDDGEDGQDGADGVSPVLSIGTVTTLPAGSQATASMGGTQAEPTLNLGIPAANIWTGTQAEYDALATHDAGRLYLIQKSPAGIAYSAGPTKTYYTVGDLLNLAGAAVSIIYDDGSTEDVTANCIFSPPSGTTLDTAGTVTVTASYTLSGVTYTAVLAVTVETAS